MDKGLARAGQGVGVQGLLPCCVKGLDMHCEGLDHAVAMHRAFQGDVELPLGCAGCFVESVAVTMGLVRLCL